MTTDRELAERLRELAKAMALFGESGADDVAQAAARLEQRDKDAERYRWLRGDAPAESTRWPRWEVRYWDGRGWQNLLRSELDAAIDDALREEAPQSTSRTAEPAPNFDDPPF